MSNDPSETTARPGESMDAGPNTLTIVRMFNAPRELVFAAWTDPDRLATWWGPAELHTPRESVSIDPRVGGEWSATMVMNDGSAEFPSTGIFSRFDPPDGFEMREEPTEMFPFANTMTVSLEELDHGTKMTIVQHFATESFDFADSIQGWGSTLEKLRALVNG